MYINLSCELLQNICNNKNCKSPDIVRLICVAIRVSALQFANDLELSMLFQLNSSDIGTWKDLLEKNGNGFIENISHNFVDENYISWSSLSDDFDPTEWIRRTMEKVEDASQADKRLILPFCRLLAYDVSLMEISDAFCMDIDTLRSWRSVGKKELRKYMSKFN
ncbi:MAG: hypothetical protein KAH32_04990 [Chlamydiia bacterium]|nr:hypothetical protein [Chlamydiia bacterium]